jgi:hypothetical protein
MAAHLQPANVPSRPPLCEGGTGGIFPSATPLPPAVYPLPPAPVRNPILPQPFQNLPRLLSSHDMTPLLLARIAYLQPAKAPPRPPLCEGGTGGILPSANPPPTAAYPLPPDSARSPIPPQPCQEPPRLPLSDAATALPLPRTAYLQPAQALPRPPLCEGGIGGIYPSANPPPTAAYPLQPDSARSPIPPQPFQEPPRLPLSDDAAALPLPRTACLQPAKSL